MAYASKVPLALNVSMPSDDPDRFEWLRIWTIAQGVQVLLDVQNLGEVVRGLKVLGRV